MKLPAPHSTIGMHSLHALLLSIEEEKGRPSQILGPELRIRWNQGNNELFELALAPQRDTTTPRWTITARVKDRHETLYDEYLSIKYVTDPDMTGYLPYLWNLRVNPELWDQDNMSPIVSWDVLCADVGRVLGQLPMSLAALPTSWFDETITVLDTNPECLTAVASRDGLLVTLLLVAGDHRGTHQFAFPTVDALGVGDALIESYAANFGPGYPVEQTSLHMKTPNSSLLSDFYTSGFSYDEDEGEAPPRGDGPAYSDHIPQLIALSQWHHGPIPGEVMAKNLADFPVLKQQL